MFVRKLKHPNGRTYIQVIEKKAGKFLVKKSFGSAISATDMEKLVKKAEGWIENTTGSLEFDFDNESAIYQNLLNNITSHKLVGIDLVLGKIFDQIGFNKIEDNLFRHLVLYRLVYPKSKLKTTEYLYRYEQKQYSENDIYRYMDKLYATQKELAQDISYRHTLKVLNGKISVVFYDVTTIYFEIDKDDELRKTGFSKDGKHQNPQIVLGLLVSRDGYPLAYEIFEGNKFEGHTMLPVIESFRKKYKLAKLIIVADSGLLSKQNMEDLQSNGYEFILGARIKNESKPIKEQIEKLKLKNGESAVIDKDGLRLIITYSNKRAIKDEYNRKKGIKRLEKQLKTGRLTKAHINKRGYNKFLKMQGGISISIDRQKVKQDIRWDGLKGYITNAQLNTDELMDNYQQLWQIEKAFRIAKTELKIRPVFHYKQRRVEAHICLNFVAYKVYKELERQLKEKQTNMSASKAIEIAQNIYQIEVTTPKTKKKLKKILLFTSEQRQLAQLFDFGC